MEGRSTMTRFEALLRLIRRYDNPAPGAVLDVWQLAGDQHRKTRQAVMSALLDRRATVAESGVGRIQARVMELCPRNADECLAQWESRVGAVIAAQAPRP